MLAPRRIYPTSVRMDAGTRAILHCLVQEEACDMSVLIRRAVREYARWHGYDVDAMLASVRQAGTD